jgi:hypothetical protein
MEEELQKLEKEKTPPLESLPRCIWVANKPKSRNEFYQTHQHLEPFQSHELNRTTTQNFFTSDAIEEEKMFAVFRKQARTYFSKYKKKETQRRSRYLKKKQKTYNYLYHRCEMCQELKEKMNLFWGVTLCTACYFNPINIQFVMYNKFRYSKELEEEYTNHIVELEQIPSCISSYLPDKPSDSDQIPSYITNKLRRQFVSENPIFNESLNPPVPPIFFFQTLPDFSYPTLVSSNNTSAAAETPEENQEEIVAKQLIKLHKKITSQSKRKSKKPKVISPLLPPQGQKEEENLLRYLQDFQEEPSLGGGCLTNPTPTPNPVPRSPSPSPPPLPEIYVYTNSLPSPPSFSDFSPPFFTPENE